MAIPDMMTCVLFGRGEWTKMNQYDEQSPVGRGTGLNHVGRFESKEFEPDWSQMEFDDEFRQHHAIHKAI